MRFLSEAHTDIGISKKMNQDAYCLKIASTKKQKVAFAGGGEGMGGFESGELASAFVAKNVIDKDVRTLNYANVLAKRSSWKHYDATGKEVKDVKLADKHVAVITYDVDANYTFDFEYNDLAMNSSANYAKDKFTVDKTAPKHLKVSYSTSVFENVLKAITFGYYDEQVTVTISAEDETSGIWHYLYLSLIHI